MLRNLLEKLQNQQTDGLFTYSVVIVDNDINQSARDAIEAFMITTNLKIDYYNEPEPNISLARNMAVENAKGAFIAFIDDDEFPEYSWLINLFKTYQRYKCTGVLGPVKPYFEEAPPEWLVKGNFCVRDSFKTGHVLHPKNTRTGNVLLSSTIFDERSNRFILEFGRTGGEDVQFFLKSIGEGHIFVWCEEAIVYEHIPPERQKKSFYLRKDLRMGGLTGEMHRSVFHSRSKYLAKVSAAFFLYLALLPFSFLFGQHNYMKCLTKSLYFLGCISGFLGYVPIRYR